MKHLCIAVVLLCSAAVNGQTLTVKARVYLEGALINNGNVKSSDNTRHLMRDNLRRSPFNNQNYIPLQDPYAYPLPQFNKTARYTHLPPGNDPMYQTITDPNIFAVTGENAIVDWIWLELRDKDNSTTRIATRSALIQRDGDIVDLDGVSQVMFPGVAVDHYFLVIRHGRHLGVMSKFALSPTTLATMVDFTQPGFPTFDYGVHANGTDYTGLAQNGGVKVGVKAMWAGDFDSNAAVRNNNPSDDTNVQFHQILTHPSNVNNSSAYDFAYGYISSDFDMNSKLKFQSPNDDKNMLFAQVILYPGNTQYMANYANMLEQLP
jgi:hypothetical protein